MTDYKREIAYRLFATEINECQVALESEGERAPSYVLSPTGIQVNRVHFVGKVTSVEPVGESGETFRMRVSDHTGSITVYAGAYQPEASHVMSELVPPTFVAVTGKVRHYEPEPGRILVSIRPETVQEVTEMNQTYWLTETATQTIARVRAMANHRGGSESEPIVRAKRNYEPDLKFYEDVSVRALQSIALDGQVEFYQWQPPADGGSSGPSDYEAPGNGSASEFEAPKPASTSEAEKAEEAFDEAVLSALQGMEGTKGVNWDDLVENLGTQGKSEDEVDASINRLLDKGLVFEPTIGVLRSL